MLGGIIFVTVHVGFAPQQIFIGMIYGLLISAAIGTFEFFASSGPPRDWLGSLSLSASLAVGVAPRIRGSLHFGTVIVGEIGDIKRAIVFNGDVMNTAARLEEQSRNIEGGFVASRTAIDRFKSAPPVPLHDLGVRDIRGKSDGIAVMGLAT